MIKEILVSEKKFTDTNNEIFKKVLVYIINNLIHPDGDMYFTVDSLKERNNTGKFKEKLL